MSPAEWEPDANDWVRWARTPGHDAYWYFRDRFFNDVVPAPGRRTLEIGCGEGRVARDLIDRGHRVTAVDPSISLVRAALDLDQRGSFLVADGAQLPFAGQRFDLVIAYNVLQVVAELAGTVREVARVLKPGGRLCACVVHPFTDLGHFVDDTPDATFALRPNYFERIRVDDPVERDGLTMTFRGWSYPLEDYARAFEAAGLGIELLREPTPIGTSSYERWRRAPLFLNLRAVKR
jgi:SAM-dependent methyltransferase